MNRPNGLTVLLIRSAARTRRYRLVRPRCSYRIGVRWHEPPPDYALGDNVVGYRIFSTVFEELPDDRSQPGPMSLTDYDGLKPPEGQIWELHEGYIVAFSTRTGRHGILCTRIAAELDSTEHRATLSARRPSVSAELIAPRTSSRMGL